MKEKIIEILEWYSAVVGTQRYNDAIPDIADEIVALLDEAILADKLHKSEIRELLQSTGDEVI